MTMNYLKKKYNHLVIDQEDKALREGLLLKDYKYIINNTYIYTRSTNTEYIYSANYNVYVLQIPKGAKKLTLKTNSQYQFSGEHNCGIGYINGYTITSAMKTTVEIDIDNAFKYIGITARTSQNLLSPKASFKFE